MAISQRCICGQVIDLRQIGAQCTRCQQARYERQFVPARLVDALSLGKQDDALPRRVRGT